MPSVTLAHSIAATRFGFGAQPGELDTIGADPKAWLRSQTAPGSASEITGANLSITGPVVSTVDYLEGLRTGVAGPSWSAVTGNTPKEKSQHLFNYNAWARAKFTQATKASFRERFVHFWGNHFAVSLKAQLTLNAEALEREAVRPHVMGKFEDMLIAVAQHPIMIDFLENQFSTGPNSPNGKHGGGINENLAREIMELHTLGVDGGYAQTDVIAFSNVITGWSYSSNKNGILPHGQFWFNSASHEPGPQTILGKTYNQTGVDQGLAVLRDFANHPATVTRICTKLASHFHSDNPPQSLVGSMVAAWKSSGGDLSKVAGALIDAPEMWSATQAKVKSTEDYCMSMWRAVYPWVPETFRVTSAYSLMYQMPFGSGSPAGYSDSSVAWSAPGILRARIQATYTLAVVLAGKVSGDIPTLASKVLGPLLSPATLSQIQSAPNKTDALSILFLSPEFQRR